MRNDRPSSDERISTPPRTAAAEKQSAVTVRVCLGDGEGAQQEREPGGSGDTPDPDEGHAEPFGRFGCRRLREQGGRGEGEHKHDGREFVSNHRYKELP